MLVDQIEQRQKQKHKLEAKRRPKVKLEFGKDIFDDDQAFWLLVPLFVLHFTLSAIVRQQYLGETRYTEDLKAAAPSIPFFWLLQRFVHPKRHNWIVSLVVLAVAGSAAIYCFKVSNETGYYAAMSKLPPIGTLVVWAVLELPWEYDLVFLALTAAAVKYYGYTF